jgi:hypothetical protein
MKSVAESRGGYLRERGAQRARRIRNTAGLDLELRVAGAEHVAEFMNDSTLLRHHQHEQKAQQF